MRIIVREDATEMTIIEAWVAVRMILSDSDTLPAKSMSSRYTG